MWIRRQDTPYKLRTQTEKPTDIPCQQVSMFQNQNYPWIFPLLQVCPNYNIFRSSCNNTKQTSKARKTSPWTLYQTRKWTKCPKMRVSLICLQGPSEECSDQKPRLLSEKTRPRAEICIGIWRRICFTSNSSKKTLIVLNIMILFRIRIRRTVKSMFKWAVPLKQGLPTNAAATTKRWSWSTKPWLELLNILKVCKKVNPTYKVKKERKKEDFDHSKTKVLFQKGMRCPWKFNWIMFRGGVRWNCLPKLQTKHNKTSFRDKLHKQLSIISKYSLSHNFLTWITMQRSERFDPMIRLNNY